MPKTIIVTFCFLLMVSISGCDPKAKLEFDSAMPIEEGWEGIPWGTLYSDISDDVDLSTRAKKEASENGSYTLEGWINRRVIGLQAEGRLFFTKHNHFCSVIFVFNEYSLGEDRFKPIFDEFSRRYGSAGDNPQRPRWLYKDLSMELFDKGVDKGLFLKISSWRKCAEARYNQNQKRS